MDDAQLIRRLAALEPPQIEAARERAAEAVPPRVAAVAETAKIIPGGWFMRSREIRGLRLAAAALAICLALTSFALFTQPGHAVTSWVGERLGFGQPGEPPSLRQLRAGWTKGTAAEGQPAYVLAVGPVPGGGRYEFITYWPEQPEGVGRPGAWKLDGPCFELDLTQMRSSYGEGCGVLPEGPHLAALGLGGGGMPGEELHHFAGRTSMAVEEIEAELGGRPLEAELVPIPAEFVERFRLERRFKFFIGFLEGAVRGGALTITARDGAGEVLARKRIEVIDRLAIRRSMCEEAKRILREGEMSRRNALRNMRAWCEGLP